MAQKEIWFVCPTCARPIRVAGKFIGAEFVHPPCGATVRAPDPAKGRPEVELVAEPEVVQVKGVKPVEIDKVEGAGLFIPRRLREGGGNIEQDAAGTEGGDDVHALAEKIAKALIEKGGKGQFTDLREDDDDDDAASGEGEADDGGAVGVAANFDPIREKASRMGFGSGPVDTEALKKQFNKSLDELKDEGADDVDVLEANRRLSTQKERQVVMAMTPWEAEGDDGAADTARRAASAERGGGFPVRFVIVIALVVLGVVFMLANLLSDDQGKGNPLDKPIRPSSGGR